MERLPHYRSICVGNSSVTISLCSQRASNWIFIFTLILGWTSYWTRGDFRPHDTRDVTIMFISFITRILPALEPCFTFSIQKDFIPAANHWLSWQWNILIQMPHFISIYLSCRKHTWFASPKFDIQVFSWFEACFINPLYDCHAIRAGLLHKFTTVSLNET